MKKLLYVLSIIFLLSTSCSSNYYLKKAIKLNPKLLDSLKITTIIYHTDTIHDTIRVEGHNFKVSLDSLRQSTTDSLNLVYSDSILNIYAYIDNISKKIKIGGYVKPKTIINTIIVHDTITVKTDCPQQFVVQEKTKLEQFFIYLGYLFSILLIIGVVILVIKLFK